MRREGDHGKDTKKKSRIVRRRKTIVIMQELIFQEESSSMQEDRDIRPISMANHKVLMCALAVGDGHPLEGLVKS